MSTLEVYKNIFRPLNENNISKLLSIVAYQATDAASEVYEINPSDDDYEIIKETFLRIFDLSLEKRMNINVYKAAFTVANRYFERI